MQPMAWHGAVEGGVSHFPAALRATPRVPLLTEGDDAAAIPGVLLGSVGA